MNSYEIIAWLGRHVERSAHLCLDSRFVEPGDVFFACPGKTVDGREYIDDAIDRGAVAVVSEHGTADRQAELGVPYVQVRHLSRILGEVAHHWYREPSHALSVVAVTGTNGKTTCVNWIAHVLNAEGLPCGTIGTLGVIRPDGQRVQNALTTPDILTMHRTLAMLRDAGALVVALEASSIGIDQGRLDHVRIEVAAFTNLSHDHLDYHGNTEAYKETKFRLFDWPHLGAAVVNIDDAAGREFCARMTAVTPITYSIDSDRQADIQASNIDASGYGLVFTLRTPRGQSQLLTRLVGIHNISNLLLVAGVLRQLGWGMARTVRELGALMPVEGRMQMVDAIHCGPSRALPMAVVDYSHTPAALERALEALTQTASARGGQLHCVIGCGGGRDHEKRPMMGQVAERLAQRVILTSDNPRHEDPQDIIDQIRAGMKRQPEIELSRSRAILSALWQADEKDIVLIGGKGHEVRQEFADRAIAFDDRQWARLALTWRRGATLSTDTRSLTDGNLFLALAGANFDGHDYLEEARQAGACAAIVSQPDETADIEQIVVADTQQALTDLATMWRRQFRLPVIAITGSNGKTTTKEMVASILRHWQGDDFVLATAGNFNNHIGVPLTLLRLAARHQVAVIEMGMNRPGEIACLADIGQPTIALVNNAQREHLEFMHTVEAVAEENGSVLTALPVDGVAVIPADDAFAAYWTDLSGDRKVLRFGFESDCDVTADHILAQPDSTEFHLHTPAGSGPVVLRARGLHNLRNALAAVACAIAANVPFTAIVRGLEAFDPVAGRTHTCQLGDGLLLIDDTYNANPDSVRAAIDVLSDLQGRRVLVLGDMGEIGAQADQLHAEMGHYAAEQGIDAVLTLGEASRHAAEAFGHPDMSFTELDDLQQALVAQLPANVLVKGSRSARMERVVQALERHLAEQGGGDDHAA